MQHATGRVERSDESQEAEKSVDDWKLATADFGLQ